jgi:hypothetical protein
VPDGMFLNQKLQIWHISEALGIENCDIFDSNLVFSWSIGIFDGNLVFLWSIGIFDGHLAYLVSIWYVFPAWYVVGRKIWQPW